MSEEEHRQVRNIIRWNRIGCIVVKMSERFHISVTDALDIFYKSNTCRRFHDEKILRKAKVMGFSDKYIGQIWGKTFQALKRRFRTCLSNWYRFFTKCSKRFFYYVYRNKS